MCKLYIETSDLDSAILDTVSDSDTGAKGGALDLLASEQLLRLSIKVARGAEFTAPVPQASHTLKLGILIGLKLAESDLSLDIDLI